MAGIAGTLASDPSQLAGLNPGANNSGMGGSTLGPMTTAGTLGNQGGNPMIPSMPNGQGVNTAAPATTAGAPNPYSTTGATNALANLGGPNTSGGNPNTGGGQFGYTGTDLAKSLQKSGVAGGAGTALAQFLNTGAGYSPQVAQALVAAMQPQFAQGASNLMEQFGSAGAANSSVAGLAMGNYEAQTNLEVGQLLSGLYEQSVQNYMGVLTGMKNTPKQPFWEQLLNTAVGDVHVGFGSGGSGSGSSGGGN